MTTPTHRVSERAEQLLEKLGGKVMYADSIYYYHHFGADPKGLPIYKDAERCKAEHPCIQMSEAHPEDPRASCTALKIAVIEFDEFAKIAGEICRRLAEEAERRYESLPHPARGSVCAKEFAAWLRAKAEEEM